MTDPLAAPPLPRATATFPRVLVADDDPASCRFLGDGLRSLGAQVATCADGLAALQHGRAERFDLLLLDCRMPGAGALQILQALRDDAQAQSRDSIAVATTAELDPSDHPVLLAAGFSEILIKPCRVADLQRMLTLAQPAGHGSGLLDDRAALDSSGDAATMHALRRLLRDELTLLLQELEPLGRDPAAFGERLHRLRSSCGFCGAAALATETVAMERRLRQHGATPAALTRFRQVVLATVQALDG